MIDPIKNNAECKKKWEEFKSDIQRKISEIDNETIWEDVEPKWWLEMMEVYRMVSK